VAHYVSDDGVSLSIFAESELKGDGEGEVEVERCKFHSALFLSLN
jgi:hypothetical protein